MVVTITKRVLQPDSWVGSPHQLVTSRIFDRFVADTTTGWLPAARRRPCVVTSRAAGGGPCVVTGRTRRAPVGMRFDEQSAPA